jgi:hypothetical protein
MDPDAFDAILDGRSSGGFRSDRPLRCPAMLVRADPGLGAAFGEEHERLLATTSPRVVVNALSGSHNLRGDRQTRESYLGLLTEFLDSLP